MTTMRKLSGPVGCVRRLLGRIPPPTGQRSRFHSARLRGCGRVGPSSFFKALTAAALSGLGATVTSHHRDILKVASQQRDEF